MAQLIYSHTFHNTHNTNSNTPSTILTILTVTHLPQTGIIAKSQDDLVYEFYSQLSYEQLDQFYNLYLEDCILFDFKCQETLCKIKRRKVLRANGADITLN